MVVVVDGIDGMLAYETQLELPTFCVIVITNCI